VHRSRQLKSTFTAHLGPCLLPKSRRCGGQILLATCQSLSLLAAFWPADMAECILQLKPQLQLQPRSKRNGISPASRLVSYRFHLLCLERTSGGWSEKEGAGQGQLAKQMANGCSYQSVAASALGKAKSGLSHPVPDSAAEAEAAASAAVSQADVNVLLWFAALLSS